MKIVDSSAWIEWLDDSHLADALHQYISDQSGCALPTIVQYEVYKWLERELGESAARAFIAMTLPYRVIPLSTSIAVEAAEIGKQHRLAMADAIIYATALHVDAHLVTCDAHFAGLDNVTYLPKR
jgi:predicted nucleic acid-binding protein